MAGLFLQIVNMSISASWIVLVVLVLRLVLKKAPKWINGILWGIVGLRLVMPFSIESVFSLLPSGETISKAPESPRPYFESGVAILDTQVNDYLKGTYFEGVTRPTGHFADVTTVLAILWIIGVAALLVYSLVSYLRLKGTIGTAVRFRDNIYQSERVISPFVLGVINPKIYLPFRMSEADMTHVIAHEKAHIKRRDHIWKPLGFLLLTLHWFNPLMWFGYVLLCRDIELACDEKVVKEFDTAQKADYSQALLTCSVNRRMIAACPLAFGEVGVKSRVKSVLHYKKPAFWLVVVAIVASVAVGVCFLTDPKNTALDGLETAKNGSELDGVSLEIVSADLTPPDPLIRVRWNNKTAEPLMYGDEYYIYCVTDDGLEDCRLTPNYVWHAIGYGIDPHGASVHEYSLKGMDMTQAGTYRLETDFFVDGKPDVDYRAWIEFTLEDGVPSGASHTLDAITLVYSDGMYSYIQNVESVPRYCVTSTMQLQELDESGNVVKNLGLLERVTLSKNTFDSRFHYVYDSTLKTIKKHNERAWQLQANDELYLLLEQDDGTFYLGYGYYNVGSEAPANPDDSHIRWLYELAVDTPTISSFAGEVSLLVSSEEINILKGKYPRYFGLPVDNGLEVYIWQMAEDSYSCGLLPAKDGGYTREELFDLHTLPTSLEEMRMIVASYIPEITRQEVSIRAIAMPHSSYHNEGLYLNAQTYTEQLTERFWKNFPILVAESFSDSIIDSATFDIDGDGVDELCTLGYGPTSGVLTVVLYAAEAGDDATLKYRNTYMFEHGVLSFVQTEDGMRLRSESNVGNTVVDYEFSVKDGNVYLTADGEHAAFWGEQGVEP